MKKLRIGIIGCGRISMKHFDAAAASDMAELIACCDVKIDRAEEKSDEYSIKAYTNYKEMLLKEELDAVHLCLPHYLHSTVAIYCMEYGVNVITEKPMDIDLESALRAIAVAKKTGKILKFMLQ